jgi:hypothetical protein
MKGLRLFPQDPDDSDNDDGNDDDDDVESVGGSRPNSPQGSESSRLSRGFQRAGQFLSEGVDVVREKLLSFVSVCFNSFQVVSVTNSSSFSLESPGTVTRPWPSFEAILRRLRRLEPRPKLRLLGQKPV